METATFYKPSGKVPVMGIINSLFWGILVGTAFSFLYVPACIHIPFIYLNLIIWAIFAAIGGLGVLASLKICKVRNPFVASFLGAIVGLSTLYIHWSMYCAWQHGFDSHEFLRNLAHPSELFDRMSRIAENGTWSIGRFGSSQNVSGIFLWLIWLLEGAGIVLFPVFISYLTASALFSESQNRWLDKDSIKINRESFNGDLKDFKTQLLQLNFSSLFALKETSSTSSVHTKIKITSSGSPDENYLSISEAKPDLSSKKAGKMKEDEIIENMILTDVNYKKVKEGLGI